MLTYSLLFLMHLFSFTLIEAACNLTFSNGTPLTTATCPGQSTGTIIVNTTGGIPNYTFSDGVHAPAVTSFPNFTFTNEPAGTYTVSVTDGNSCTITQPNVVVPSNGFAFVNGTPITTPTCLGQNNGTIIINITGGVGPNYTFSFGFGDVTVSSPNHTFTNVPAGSYTVSVTDSSFCTITQPHVVVSIDQLAFANGTPTTTPSCFGQNTGTIVVNTTGGAGPNYTFSDGVHTPVTVASPNFTFTNEAAGTYTVSVTDSNNCTITQQNVVIAADNLTFANGTPLTTPSCFGQNTGTIVVSTTGGVGPNYTFSDGVRTPVTVASPNFTFTNEAAGTYTVSVTDSNNCTITQQNVMVAADNLAFTNGTPLTTATCPGQSTGTIIVNTTDGIPNYTFSDGVHAPAVTSSPNFTFTNEPAGTYTISVTDGNSCTITQPNVVVPSNGFAFVNGTPITTPSCLGQNTGTIVVNTTGGVGPNYTFSFGFGDVTVPSPNHTFTSVPAGSYTVSVTDSSFCTITQPNVVVSIDQLAFANGTPTTTPSCEGLSTGTIAVNTTSGVGPNYTFSDGVHTPVTVASPNFTFTNEPAGSYTVSVTDSNNCTITQQNVVVSSLSCNTTLAVFECCSSHISSCDVVTYTISIKNTGMVAATDLQVIDLLPCCLTFLSGSGEGWSFTSAGQKVTATLSNATPLLPGAITTLTIKAKAHCASDQKITNTITASASNVVVPQTSSCTTKVD